MTDGAQSEVLRPILLRSSTPASNEKVLNWVENIHREGDADPPHSVIGDEDYKSPPRSNGVYSPRPKSHNSEALRDLANSTVSYSGQREADADDADSNEQQHSEPDEPLPIREPGPRDLPGPKYASYDSAQSFGNMGPLPQDDHGYAGAFYNSWGEPNGNGQYNGHSPSKAPSGVASPKPGSVNIAVQSPTNTSKGASQSPSKKTKSLASEVKSQSRAPSRQSPSSSSTPLSPITAPKSHITGKSRPTERGAYPPLPDSRFGGDDAAGYETPLSPTRSMHPPAPKSKAYSVSPSDSLSHVGLKRMQAKAAAELPRGDGRSGVGSHLAGAQARPFSPYRHAPTNEDLMHAAARSRAMVIPEESSQAPSQAPSHRSKVASAAPALPLSPPTSPRSKVMKAPSTRPPSAAPSAARTAGKSRKGDVTPTPSRPATPADELNPEESRIVRETLARTTPRTSNYSPSVVGTEVINTHYHDGELCALFKELEDPGAHEVVKKAVRKAVRQRVKKLGMSNDDESIAQYQLQHRESHGDEEPPKWAADLKREIVLMQQRIESLGPKIENLRITGGSQSAGEADQYYEEQQTDSRTPPTQSVGIRTQPTGTLADSMYHPPESEMIIDDNDPDFDDRTEREIERQGETTNDLDSEAARQMRDDSPGQMYLEEELYKLRQRKPQGSQSGLSHRTWEVARNDDADDDEFDDEHLDHDDGDGLQGVVPTIPGSEGADQRSLPPLPPAEEDRSMVASNQWVGQPEPDLAPWQRIQQRLLGWAITWPMSAIDAALNSTTRGNQVDEVALTIWSTQTYKRYVRAKLTERPPGVVDRLFVPPNVADAISNAVFHGRHGDACGMLRDLWAPFGLEGMPRLLIVLAKHRNDDNHWVVHRFCLPEGTLTTYDSYPERTLPDGRPLGWWFAIRIAWPNATYPSPDHLMQKMVRLHRPMQLPIDNSVSATGIWRNLLMASRAERSLDLERLRDMINTEAKNLRQRKMLGKLSIAPPQSGWQDVH